MSSGLQLRVADVLGMAQKAKRNILAAGDEGDTKGFHTAERLIRLIEASPDAMRGTMHLSAEDFTAIDRWT